MLSHLYTLPLLLVMLLAAHPTLGTPNQLEPRGLRAGAKNGNIYGGSSASAEMYPFIAAVFERGNISCGATIVSPSWIITAAHCLVTPENVVGSIKAIPRAAMHDLHVGVGSLLNSTKYPIAVKRVVISPKYNVTTNEHDIAMLELNTTLTYNNTVQPAMLAGGKVKAGESVTALGWGYTEAGAVSSSLLQVDLQIAEDDKCHAGNAGWQGQDSELVCTGNTPGKDTCYGDSGGPLVRAGTVDANGKNTGYQLLGVTSFGIDLDNPTSTLCGQKSSIGYYAHPLYYADWIAQTAGMSKEQMVTAGAPGALLGRFSLTLLAGSLLVSMLSGVLV